MNNCARSDIVVIACIVTSAFPPIASTNGAHQFGESATLNSNSNTRVRSMCLPRTFIGTYHRNPARSGPCGARVVELQGFHFAFILLYPRDQIFYRMVHGIHGGERGIRFQTIGVVAS